MNKLRHRDVKWPVICCRVTNYFQTQWLETTINMHSFTQFLWLRDLRVAHWSGSCKWLLMSQDVSQLLSTFYVKVWLRLTDPLPRCSLTWLLTVASIPCNMDLYTGLIEYPPNMTTPEQVIPKGATWKLQHLVYLDSEVTLHNFHNILLVT